MVKYNLFIVAISCKVVEIQEYVKMSDCSYVFLRQMLENCVYTDEMTAKTITSHVA